MILYSVIVSFIVLVFLALKGPAELYFLQTVGINLVDAFEASFGFDSTKILIKGGLTFGILVVQPLVFGIIFLKILDKIFGARVAAKVDAELPIKAMSLERHEEMVRRGQQEIDHKRVADSDKGSIITDVSGTATMSINEGLYKGEKLDWSYMGVAKPIVRFRGSRTQLLTTQALLFLCIVCLLASRVEWVELPMFALLVVLLAPSYILYLMFLPRFVTVQTPKPKTNQRKMFEQLATELRILGEMRDGRYCFQSSEFAYRLFRYLPAIRRFATLIPVI